jgi:predicted nuclease of predicted toxin-antitoxin system
LRFLLDQDVYAVTARFLQNLGHDVVSVGSIGRAQATDAELLQLAKDRERVFVTRDRDFGQLIFAEGLRAGVIYLRILPSTQDAVHRELARVLTRHMESELGKVFIVVEPGRHRVRKLPDPTHRH